MKTSSSARSLVCVAIVFIIAGATSCSSYKSFEGDRLYYDFKTKQLHQDSAAGEVISRPIKVKENNEIQLEVFHFNPLKHNIRFKETSSNVFDYGIGNFPIYSLSLDSVAKSSKNNNASIKNSSNGINFLSNLPLLHNDTSEIVQDTIITKGNSVLKEILDLQSQFDSVHSIYLEYISKLNGISNYYLYVKNLDYFDPEEIEEGISSEILKPLGIDETEMFTIGLSDFEAKEKELYTKIDSLKTAISISKDSAEILFSKNKDKLKLIAPIYDSIYNQLNTEISQYEALRTTKYIPYLQNIALSWDALKSLQRNKPILVSPSYIIKDDLHTINIYAYDNTSKTETVYDAINVRVTNALRITTSVGFFVSGLHDDQFSSFTKDSTFIENPLSTEEGNTTITDKFTAFYPKQNMKASYGGMIYLNMYSQSQSCHKLGGYIGLGALFNEQTRWTGSLGVSLLLGRNSLCIISLGVAMAQTEVLEAPYQPNYFYRGTFNKVPTTQAWQKSVLFGISIKIPTK